MVERGSWSIFLSGVVVGALCLYALYEAQSVFKKKTEDGGTTQEEEGSPEPPSSSSSSSSSTQDISHRRLTLEDVMRQNDNKLEIQAIGVVRSVYRLCVGTPRQGLLAPHARGRIDLTRVPSETVDGLEEYSHIWILFIFHLNTLPKQSANRSSSSSTTTTMTTTTKAPMKIAPPILGGRKIGVLSSRSPHRPNPVGVTLARLDRLEKSNKVTSLYLSGIDLVDGTPVVDIKPFVPLYDSDNPCIVPNWVAGGLALKRKVAFSPEADEQLASYLRNGEQDTLAFYGRQGESPEHALTNVKACIEEVLSSDVRSQWQTKKARQGKFQAERADRLKQLASLDAERDDLLEHAMDGSCSQQIDNLLIRFHVNQPRSSEELQQQASNFSGAEDDVVVTSIELLK